MEISPAYEGEHPVIEALSSLPTEFDSFIEWVHFLAALHFTDPPPYLPKLRDAPPLKYSSNSRFHFFPKGSLRFIDNIEICAELNRTARILNNIFYGYDGEEMIVVKTPNSLRGSYTSELSKRMKREMEALKHGDAPFWINPRDLIYTTSLSSRTSPDNIVNIKTFPHLILPFVHPGLALEDFCMLKEFQEISRTDEFIAALGIQLCMACDYFHKRNIIVRDLKPNDIMVTAPSRDKGFIVCLDGGLFLARGLSRLTEPGIVCGTPGYIAPETLSHEMVDECSDVYSLGCVLYFTAAGHKPFYGETFAEILHKTRHENPNGELLNGLKPELKELILRMLAKNPDERPQSMEEAASCLQRLLGDSVLRDYLGPARNFGMLSMPDVFDPKTHAALAEVLEK